MNSIPIGTIIAFAGNKPPKERGWLLCDGSIKNGDDHGDKKLQPLYDAIGTSWGRGDGSADSFHLPDLRGIFLRGWEPGPNNDLDGIKRTAQHIGGKDKYNVGSVQEDDFKKHKHDQIGSGAGPGDDQTYDINYHKGGVGAFGHTDEMGGIETRPKNAYVAYYINYL